MKFFGIAVLLLVPFCAFAQQQKPSEPYAETKEFAEAIQRSVDEYANTLKLEDWQVFYVDSILVHNYTEMNNEMEALNKAKVSKSNYYEDIRDKWDEATYNAFHAVLDDNQWNKYLKTGAGREKKDRDKRAAKRNK